MAGAALLDLGLFDGVPAERAKLALASGEAAIAARDGLTSLRARIGLAEERIDHASTRIAAERTALEIARNDIVGADPYETATKLQEVERQLQTLYTMTGRMSELSLTNYLR